MKYLVVLALIAFACLSAVTALNSTYGVIQQNDILLANDYVFKSNKNVRIVTKEYKFGYVKGNHTMISAIKAIDLNQNGKGASASILSGGPGQRNVTLRFKSQRAHGIKFQVKIYGH